MMQRGATADIIAEPVRARPRLSSLIAVTVFFTAIALSLATLSWPVEKAPPEARTASRLDFHIIDAITFEDRASGTQYRLANVDAPEIGKARCASERDLGNQAAAAVRVLFSRSRSVEIIPTGHIDVYGRSIAQVMVDGRDLGEILAAHKLARPSAGLRKDWCDGADS